MAYHIFALSSPKGFPLYADLPQLLCVYTRQFARACPEEALAYLQFVRCLFTITFVTSSDALLDDGSTCLERGVCDAVLEAGEVRARLVADAQWELVFGQGPADPQGVAFRLLRSEEKVRELARAVAAKSERRGRVSDALRLLDHCKVPVRAWLTADVRGCPAPAGAAPESGCPLTRR